MQHANTAIRHLLERFESCWADGMSPRQPSLFGMVLKGNLSEINIVFFAERLLLDKAKDRSIETQFALMFFIAAPAAAPVLHLGGGWC